MLPKMVTEIAEFSWNNSTQHFESRIYGLNEAGERELVAVYATPPHIFLASFAEQGTAIGEFDRRKPNAEVVDLKQHG